MIFYFSEKSLFREIQLDTAAFGVISSRASFFYFTIASHFYVYVNVELFMHVFLTSMVTSVTGIDVVLVTGCVIV